MRVIIARITAILLLIVVIGAGFGGCSPAGNRTQTRFIMDTQVDLVFYGLTARQAGAIAEEVFTEMQRLENILSKYIPGSDVNRINAAAGQTPVKVQPETITIMQKALEIAGLSGGSFDPSVASLLELWGWDAGDPVVPTRQDLDAILPLVDYRRIEIDVERSTIFLPLPAMKIDLGGIAKGFIVDRGQALAKELSCPASYINAGGDIKINGKKPNGENWKIAIQDPCDPREWAAIISLQEGGIATSGDYQRFFEEDGVTYHHILDPHEGTPASGVRSVTVVAPDALTADALATAVFVLGREEGLQLLENLAGIEGAIIDEQGEMHVSSGLASKIEILSSREADATGTVPIASHCIGEVNATGTVPIASNC